MTVIKESKLLELLKGFNQAEYKRFGEFVRSPFHNKSSNVILLYEYLKKFSKDFNTCTITNEDISKQIYKEKKLNPVKVRSLVSDFVRIIEKFFIYSQFETNESYQKVILLDELNMRDLSKNFKNVLKDTMRKQRDQFNKDEEYYYNQIFLEVESFNYFLERHPTINETDFQKIAENIDFFFILTKLTLFHFMFHHRQNIDESYSYKIWLLNEILSYIEEHLDMISKMHPLVYMKYLILMTIEKSEKEKYFRDLKKFALNNIGKFDVDTMGYIFGALTNYCTLKCNLGILKFKNERFNIYKILDDRHVFDEEKFVNYSDFLNAVISALEINKISWAEYFYNKNKNKIIPMLRDDTLSLAKSQILYMKKDYGEALKLINNISYSNHYFYLRSKMLLSRIYYDKNELEPIIYIIDAARHYIKRNKKITKMNQEAFGNFFYFIHKILALREHLKPNVQETRDELISVTNVSSKEWLMNKLDEME